MKKTLFIKNVFLNGQESNRPCKSNYSMHTWKSRERKGGMRGNWQIVRQSICVGTYAAYGVKGQSACMHACMHGKK